MINLEYYKVFYYVAKLNSITLAANELFISQPAVSQAIKHLEKNLGGSLFIRTPKGMLLTPEGELLFTYASQGFEYLQLAESKYKELQTLEAGEIRIGASDMTLQFYLLQHLEKFHKLFPKIKVKVTNAPTPETLEGLSTGKIDFAVVSSPVSQETRMRVLPVCDISDTFVASDRFSDLKSKTLEFRELLSYPIICLEHNTSTRKYIDDFLIKNGTVLNPEFELATSDLIVQFAKRNLGIGCVVKNFAERMIGEGILFELKFKTPIPKRSICIVTHDKIPISPAGKKFLDILGK